MKTNLPHYDRQTRVLGCFVAGCVVVALLLLVVVLVVAVDEDRSGHSSGRCAPAVAGTVDPVTCLPYGTSGSTTAPRTKDSGSSIQKPKQNAPAAKAPSAPKAPAAPPRVSLRK
ncbi:hypothetical protein ACK03K_34180 [[Kitasatospora] papulosa]|uniref:hypothetical protein n=1 Tax=[Kitasatospora] papulosa TaxID=1464011 RepID=UPI0039081684